MQNSFHIPVNFLLMCKEIYNAKCQTHSQFIWFFFLLQSYFVFLRLKNFSYSLLSTNLAPRRASHVHSCVSTVGFCAQKANKYLESWNYYHIFYLCILHTLHWYIHTCPFFLMVPEWYLFIWLNITMENSIFLQCFYQTVCPVKQKKCCEGFTGLFYRFSPRSL